MVRVVRPGGRVVVLEITTPTRPPLSVFYAVWFDRIVPLLGRATQLIGRAFSLRRGSSHDDGGVGGVTIADAYAYLPSSVKRFPAPVQLAAELERAGLREIAYVLLAGGIVAIHAGTVGEGGPR
jgi:demethylmenaquinone methyltransferase/2-methoxy-6-polyprenyl-1,4-benzoquinol methylase